MDELNYLIEIRTFLPDGDDPASAAAEEMLGQLQPLAKLRDGSIERILALFEGDFPVCLLPLEVSHRMHDPGTLPHRPVLAMVNGFNGGGIPIVSCREEFLAAMPNDDAVQAAMVMAAADWMLEKPYAFSCDQDISTEELFRRQSARDRLAGEIVSWSAVLPVLRYDYETILSYAEHSFIKVAWIDEHLTLLKRRIAIAEAEAAKEPPIEEVDNGDPEDDDGIGWLPRVLRRKKRTGPAA